MKKLKVYLRLSSGNSGGGGAQSSSELGLRLINRNWHEILASNLSLKRLCLQYLRRKEFNNLVIVPIHPGYSLYSVIRNQISRFLQNQVNRRQVKKYIEYLSTNKTHLSAKETIQIHLLSECIDHSIICFFRELSQCYVTVIARSAPTCFSFTTNPQSLLYASKILRLADSLSIGSRDVYYMWADILQEIPPAVNIPPILSSNYLSTGQTITSHPTDIESNLQNFSSSLKICLCFGNIGPRKGVYTCMNQLALLSQNYNFKVDLFARFPDDSYSNSLKGYLETLPFFIKVDFTRQPIEYSLYDLCIFPSYSEVIGRSLLECILGGGNPLVRQNISDSLTRQMLSKECFFNSMDDLASCILNMTNQHNSPLRLSLEDCENCMKKLTESLDHLENLPDSNS